MPWDGCSVVDRTFGLLVPECETFENENRDPIGGLLWFCHGDVVGRYGFEVAFDVFWNQFGKLGGGRLSQPRRKPRWRPRPRPRS